MTKEQLIAAGLTEEQADKILAMRGKEVNDLRSQLTILTQENEKLKADSEALEQQNLSVEQLQQQAIDEAKAEKEKYSKMVNKLEVEKILISVGMQEDDYKDFIDGIVTTDAEASKAVATAMANTFKTKLAAAEEEAKNNQIKNTPRPDGGDGNGKGAESKSKDVSIAEELGKKAAESNQVSTKGLDAYIGNQTNNA